MAVLLQVEHEESEEEVTWLFFRYLAAG